MKLATTAPSEKVFQAAVPSAQHATPFLFPAAKLPASELAATCIAADKVLRLVLPFQVRRDKRVGYVWGIRRPRQQEEQHRPRHKRKHRWSCATRFKTCEFLPLCRAYSNLRNPSEVMRETPKANLPTLHLSACGQSCCPLIPGIICDNTTVPSTPFCNTAARICPPKPLGKRSIEPYDQYANDVAASAIADASAVAASAVPSACLATIATAALATRVYGFSNAAAVGVSSATGGAEVTSAAKMTVVSVFSAVPKSFFVEVPVLKVPNPKHFPP